MSRNKIEQKVRIFDLQFDAKMRRDFHDRVDEILDKGFLTNDVQVETFEAEIQKCLGVKRALAVSNGTVAIEVALKALDVFGKHILVSSNTFVATALAIEAAGGVPVPIDIDSDFRGVDPEALKSQINRFGSDIGALVIVHIGGLISNHVEDIVSICSAHQIPVIEDCAQSFGSYHKGSSAGTFGAVGSFSLQTTKVLTCGEGGFVITGNQRLYEGAKSIRFYGADFSSSGVFCGFGGNYKMPELSAALALSDLKRVNKRIAKRIQLAQTYQRCLDSQFYTTLKPFNNQVSSYYKQIVMCQFDRSHLIDYCNQNGVSITGGVYYIPLHRQPRYVEISQGIGYPNTDKFSDYHFCPPCYPELEVEQVEFVSEVLNEYARNHG